MSFDVVLHEEAETEARRGVLYYLVEAADPGIALRFEAALDRALRDVEEAPERWPIVDRKSAERRYLFARPFNEWMLVYRINDTTVHVVAVAHGRREPAYWGERR